MNRCDILYVVTVLVCVTSALVGGILEQSLPAAGVLPFAHYQGTLYLLLGRENGDAAAGFWCDFGGWSDGKTVLKTAVCEFLEETNHAYGGVENEELYQAVQTWVRDTGVEAFVLVRSEAQQPFYGIVPLLVAYKDPQTILHAPYHDKEKDAFAWIEADLFFDFVQNPWGKSFTSLLVDGLHSGIIQGEQQVRRELFALFALEENKKKFVQMLERFKAKGESPPCLE